MPGLVPGIHVLLPLHKKDVDGRDKPGHDGSPDPHHSLESVKKTDQVARVGKGLASVSHPCPPFQQRPADVHAPRL
jgi:hypothetical protein